LFKLRGCRGTLCEAKGCDKGAFGLGGAGNSSEYEAVFSEVEGCKGESRKGRGCRVQDGEVTVCRGGADKRRGSELVFPNWEDCDVGEWEGV